MVFGDETEYALSQSTEDKIFALKARMGSVAAIAQSISVYLGGNATGTARCAIYKVSDNSLIAVSEERTIPAGVRWETFNMPTKPPLTANESYYLCVWAPTITIPEYISIIYGTKAGDNIYFQLIVYTGTFPDPIVPGAWTANRSFGIYCTTTEYYDENIEGDIPTSVFVKDVYPDDYLTRYQKRQIVGYYPISGDLRSIAVCSSGELMVCSGLHVVADVAVEVSSGLWVDGISGVHVFVESGVHVVADVAVEVSSGLFVDGISGVHVYQESGAVVGISGQYVEAHIMSGFINIGSGVIDVNIDAGDTSGQVIHVGCASEIRTGDLVQLLGGISGVTAGSGGMSLCVSGNYCSGLIHSIVIKNRAGNDAVYIGGVDCKPYSGHGYELDASEAVNLDACDICDIWTWAYTSGQSITWIGTGY